MKINPKVYCYIDERGRKILYSKIFNGSKCNSNESTKNDTVYRIVENSKAFISAKIYIDLLFVKTKELKTKNSFSQYVNDSLKEYSQKTN